MAAIWTLILLALAVQASSSQLDNCPSLEGVVSDPNTSCDFTNCTSFTCQLPGEGSQQQSLTFVVAPCADPVHVVVTSQGGANGFLDSRQVFDRDGIIRLIGGRTLSVEMSRNATHLDFAISNVNGSTPSPVVPRVFMPLTPDVCMCQSLTTLASNTDHSLLLPSCSTSPDCDGVDCVLLLGGTYYIETLILPCIDSVELVVFNEDRAAIFTYIFNETGSHPLVIAGNPITVRITINSREYAMDIAATVEHFLIGAEEIFSLHTIILDRTHCNLPNFTTLPPPPPPTPLPPLSSGSSPTCRGFHAAISEHFTEPFVCGFLGGNCDAGINCTLYLLNYRYTLTVGYVDAVQNFVVRVFDQEGRNLGVGNTDVVTVSIPSPPSTTVVFIQRMVVEGVRGIQIDINLLVEVGTVTTRTLLPFSRVALLVEQCQALVQATFDPTTTCAANGNCSGLNCDLDISNDMENDMVFVVDKCKDPVLVNITAFHGGYSMSSLIQNDWIFLGGGEYLAVRMSRNATDLDFRAFVTNSPQSTEELRPVVPQVLVPLNASMCMCESMSRLAEISGHSVVETDCRPNLDCNGIRCRLNILGAIFFVEIEVSACDEILYVEVGREGSTIPLLTTQATESGTRVFEIVPGFPLTVELTLEPGDYSMLIAATIDETLFGSVEIIPHHLLILDRTSCNHRNFVTLPPLPPATPPPGPGSSVSDTCKAFYQLIRNHFMEPFSCRLQSSCDTGIQCELEILDTRYDVVISISDNSSPLTMTARKSEGMQLETKMSADGTVTNITLPRPMNSNLSLTQVPNPERSAVSMQLDLYVFALDGQPRRDVLISKTEIPLGSSGSQVSIVAVAVVVPILTLVAVAVVAGLIVLIFLKMRKRSRTKAFDFQPMSHSELEAKDLENYLGTEEGSFPSTGAGGIAAPSKNGTGSSRGGAEGKEKEGLENVDLEYETNSVEGHLV